MKAHFDDGPLAGQETEITTEEPTLQVTVATPVGEHRYVLGRIDDKKGIAHYYTPDLLKRPS